MKKGFVAIMGAGPGDPGLLTVRASERLQTAEAVVHDRLVDPRVLACCAPEALRIDVGKQPDHHPVPQTEINRMLVRLAEEGRRVVRLKGGDPFVFGRGGEECAYLREHGIPYEVVPGISSAIAAPAYAGIPMTHRDVSSSFHVFTGHFRAEEESAEGEPGLDYAAIARLEGTLVFLMGMKHLRAICEGLAANGVPPERPAAVVENGTTPRQRVISGTLGTLADLAEEKGATAPAVVVVGETAAMAERLGWFDPAKRRQGVCVVSCPHSGEDETMPSDEPLMGRTVAVTRPPDQSLHLLERLKALGAHVRSLPLIRICDPKDSSVAEAAIGSLGQYSWLAFTSVNGVESFFRLLLKQGRDARSLYHLKLAVVGPATRDSLLAHGFRTDCMPSVHNGVGLAQALSERICAGERLLVARSEIAGMDMSDMLHAYGISFTDAAVYGTEPAELEPAQQQAFRRDLMHGVIDVLTFASPSAVSAYVAAFGAESVGMAPGVRTAAIGPATARTCLDAGIRVDAVAKDHTENGLVQLVVSMLTEN